jgi:pyruvate/2-oxoglutarate dehydrogenase complex dihydrolipoamide acyltransferase (E2) component
MMIEVKLPHLGESVEKVLVTSWLKQVGDRIEKDEPLLEVTTDKVTIEVPSEHTGIIREILVEAGQHVSMDDAICRVETE